MATKLERPILHHLNQQIVTAGNVWYILQTPQMI